MEKVATRILELYPDVPALGSPYGTGNETFGLSSQYKRFAAIRQLLSLKYLCAIIDIVYRG